MYQVLVIDDDKLARKGTDFTDSVGKIRNGGSPEMWRTER